MQQRHVKRETYFEEQARTAKKYYIPYINKHIGVIPDKVLEVGCGEGGNLLLFGEKKATVAELLKIKRTRCTIEHFLFVVSQTNFKIINQQLFVVNPHYETKFGITSRKLSRRISRIPYLRNFLSTSCFYILKK